MHENKLIKETTDVYGRRLKVKYMFLGSIFRQFVLSRENLTRIHFVQPTCMALAVSGFIVFAVKAHYDKFSTFGIIFLTMTFITVLCIYSNLADVVEESVQVIEGFGIQLSSKNRFGTENKLFFDFNSIKSILINEAVTMQRVIFYLILVVKNDCDQDSKTWNLNEGTKLVTVFKHTVPKLEIIRDIYDEVQPFLPSDNDAEEN